MGFHFDGVLSGQISSNQYAAPFGLSIWGRRGYMVTAVM